MARKSGMDKLKDWLFNSDNNMNNIKEDSVMKTNNITIETVNPTAIETCDESFKSYNPRKNSAPLFYVLNLEYKIKAKLAKRTDGRRYEVMPVSIGHLSIDMNYQREHTIGEVAKIIRDFDINKVDIKTASIRDGKIWLIDGFHTYEAMKQLDYTEMECRVFVDLTEADEAEMFRRQDDNKTRIRPYENFKAALKDGRDETTNIIKRVCDKYGVTIKQEMSNKNCNINSLKGVIKIVKWYGEEGFDYVLKAIKDSGWPEEKTTYNERVLTGLAETYLDCGHNSDNYGILLTQMHQAENAEDFIEWAVDYCYVNGINKNSHICDKVGGCIKHIITKKN